VEIDIEWSEAGKVRVSLKAGADGRFLLRYKQHKKILTLRKGENSVIDF
jgi:hypothetical protein